MIHSAASLLGLSSCVLYYTYKHKKVWNVKDHCLLNFSDAMPLLSFSENGPSSASPAVMRPSYRCRTPQRDEPTSGTWAPSLASVTHGIFLPQALQGWNLIPSQNVREVKLTPKSYILNFWQQFVSNYGVIWGFIKSNTWASRVFLWKEKQFYSFFQVNIF